MKRCHIAIAEDDQATGDLITLAIGQIGNIRVSRAGTASDLFRIVSHDPVDLILLDLELPDEHGIAIARQIRAGSETPIIVVTSVNSQETRNIALDIGVDDFICKPFDVKEFQLRVRNILHRTAQSGRRPLTENRNATRSLGTFILDPNERTITAASGNQVPLTKNEFLIISALANARGRPVSRNTLLDAITQTDDAPGERAIDIYIRNLREKLGDAAATPSLIHTVRGVGYRMPH